MPQQMFSLKNINFRLKQVGKHMHNLRSETFLFACLILLSDARTFANRLDPESQIRQNIGPDLDPFLIV